MTKNSTHLLSHKLWATSSSLTNPGLVLRVSRMQSGCQWSLWAHPRLTTLFQDDSCWQNSAPCCEELKPSTPKGCLHFHSTRLSLQAGHVHHDSRCFSFQAAKTESWAMWVIKKPRLITFAIFCWRFCPHSRGGTTQRPDYTRI